MHAADMQFSVWMQKRMLEQSQSSSQFATSSAQIPPCAQLPQLVQFAWEELVVSHGLLGPPEVVVVVDAGLLVVLDVGKPVVVLAEVGKPVVVLAEVGKPVVVLAEVGKPLVVFDVDVGKPVVMFEVELGAVLSLAVLVLVLFCVVAPPMPVAPPTPAGAPTPMSVEPVAHANGTATTRPMPVDTTLARIKTRPGTRIA
jgi:hypothetical protein